MPTLILTPRMTEDSIALWRAALRLGWGVERMPHFRPTGDLQVDDQPVLYVEALTAPLFAEAFGVSLTEPPVDWLPRLPWEYRSRDISLVTLAEARSLDEPRFIKPPNDKSFQAGIYRGRELPAEYPPDTPVLVSSVVSWSAEFRCFVLDRKVETFSVYCRQGQPQRASSFASSEEEDAGLLAFMSRLLGDQRVELPRAAVVDAGMIVGEGWAVVEQNAAWGSGIYGCDPQRVLGVLRQASVPARGPR